MTTGEQMIMAMQSGEVQGVELGLMIASKKTAGGIQKALNLKVPQDDILVMNPKMYAKYATEEDNDRAFGDALMEEFRRRAITVFTQNGWVKKTPRNFIEEFEQDGGHGYNQHPVALPDFGGEGMYSIRTHAAVLDYWQRRARRDPRMWEVARTHALAQRVHPEYDKGAVVLYNTVNVLRTDTPEILQKRVIRYEHPLQIELLQRIGSGNVHDREDYQGVVDEEGKADAIAAKAAALLLEA
jgi:folate-dependent phosphoribosylglycinamide formyltransferase PurN